MFVKKVKETYIIRSFYFITVKLNYILNTITRWLLWHFSSGSVCFLQVIRTHFSGKNKVWILIQNVLPNCLQMYWYFYFCSINWGILGPRNSRGSFHFFHQSFTFVRSIREYSFKTTLILFLLKTLLYSTFSITISISHSWLFYTQKRLSFFIFKFNYFNLA